MGLFKKRSDPAEMEAIKADIAAMAARLDQADAEKAELGTRVQKLTSRLETPISTPPSEPPPSLPSPVEQKPPMTDAELDILRARVQRLADRLEQVDARITSISTELANQLTELSGDVEAISVNQPAPDEVVSEIREAQVRLAGEQARYQIAFREDLAALAERLRRP
jgi:predicted  nucleic acid-binding Zn-ribbon protein